MERNHLTSNIVTFWNSKWRHFSTGKVKNINVNTGEVTIKEDVQNEIHILDPRDVIPGTGRKPETYFKMLYCLWQDFEDEYWKLYYAEN